jgi:flagellar FliL protein
MADEATHEHHDEAPAKKGPGVMTLVKALAIVSVVVLAQVGAAAMLLPSAEETQEVGKQLAGAGHGDEAAHGEDDGHGDEHGDAHGGGHGEHTKEVNLGAYHIVSFNHKTGASLSVDFELFGTVLESDAQEFDHLYMAHEKRISEQITIAVRGMQVGDLADPGLGLIKRIILEKTNRALGKPLLREAVISQFSFIPR